MLNWIGNPSFVQTPVQFQPECYNGEQISDLSVYEHTVSRYGSLRFTSIFADKHIIGLYYGHQASTRD